MASANAMFGFSRLEVFMMVLILAFIGACVFLVNRSRQQLLNQSFASITNGTDPGGYLSGADSYPADGNDRDSRGSGETNIGQVSSDFSEKSLAIALPVSGNATNNAEVLAEDYRLYQPGDKQLTNALSVNLIEIEAELRRITALPWGPETEKQLQEVLARWSQSDPAAALAYAMRLEGRRAGTTAVSNLLAQWAQSDPAAAFDWFNKNLANNPQILKGAVNSLFAKMAEANPILAMDSAWQLAQKDVRDAVLHTIVNQMMAGGQKDQLLQYFNAMSDPAEQGMLARAMVDQWATYYPEMTAEWIAGLSNPAVHNSAVIVLISKWGYDNPAKAAQWVAGLTKDENWSAEVSRMIGVWANDSPDQAANWLLSLSPPSAQLDPAVIQLTRAVMNANPEGAMAWANAMSATDQRYNLMQQVGAVWMRKDPVQASAYIINSDMPDWMKRRLLRTH